MAGIHLNRAVHFVSTKGLLAVCRSISDWVMFNLNSFEEKFASLQSEIDQLKARTEFIHEKIEFTGLNDFLDVVCKKAYYYTPVTGHYPVVCTNNFGDSVLLGFLIISTLGSINYFVTYVGATSTPSGSSVDELALPDDASETVNAAQKIATMYFINKIDSSYPVTSRRNKWKVNSLTDYSGGNLIGK